MPDDIHDNLLRIASLTARLRMVEKTLELKRVQYHDLCVELVVKDRDLTRIKQENLDLRVQLKSTEECINKPSAENLDLRLQLLLTDKSG